jgi:hypothetical protein
VLLVGISGLPLDFFDKGTKNFWHIQIFFQFFFIKERFAFLIYFVILLQ